MRRSAWLATKISVIAGALVAAPLVAAGPSGADPIIANGDVLSRVTAPDGTYIKSVEVEDSRSLVITVHATSMNVDVPVQVQRPRDTSQPRPVLYLLNGADGGEGTAQWKLRTDALKFLEDKDINVVSPVGGAWSYYTDWKNVDPVLGNNKWKTFLTKELPPLIDAALGTNGKNGIAGLSTSGTTVLNLPIAAPGLYQSVAAYSGCAQTSDPVGQRAVGITVWWGGGKVENMYGAPDDPLWRENDPYLRAAELRGLSMYISTGSGIPGIHDNLGDPHSLPGVEGLANQIIIGGAIEAATNFCTHNLMNRLNELQIPAHYNFRPTGTHSWGYWEDDLKDSWPVLAGPLGIA
ncbi:alpha/beta hydrolase [Antrihabitans spumae]|uniref:Alpha/beta hydrolase n=1 Tax=Antrihabitans spumae TaxID=3373370 RepID=A0ABW7JJ66_9NOCA